MKPETEKIIREKWLPALRSGNYRQTTNYLKQNFGPNEEGEEEYGYCCLGVLCEVLDRPQFEGNYTIFFDGEEDEYDAMLSPQLSKELGITREGNFYPPVMRTPYGSMAYDNLAALNDAAGYDFNMIADFIENEILNPEGERSFREYGGDN